MFKAQQPPDGFNWLNEPDHHTRVFDLLVEDHSKYKWLPSLRAKGTVVNRTRTSIFDVFSVSSRGERPTKEKGVAWDKLYFSYDSAIAVKAGVSQDAPLVGGIGQFKAKGSAGKTTKYVCELTSVQATTVRNFQLFNDILRGQHDPLVMADFLKNMESDPSCAYIVTETLSASGINFYEIDDIEASAEIEQSSLFAPISLDIGSSIANKKNQISYRNPNSETMVIAIKARRLAFDKERDHWFIGAEAKVRVRSSDKVAFSDIDQDVISFG